MSQRDLTSLVRLPMLALMKLSYSIYETKSKLSEILRLVKKGKRITITDRGRDVARVVPLAEEEGVENRLADLIAAGVIVPATSPEMPDPSAFEVIPGALEDFIKERHR